MEPPPVDDEEDAESVPPNGARVLCRAGPWCHLTREYPRHFHNAEEIAELVRLQERYPLLWGPPLAGSETPNASPNRQVGIIEPGDERRNTSITEQNAESTSNVSTESQLPERPRHWVGDVQPYTWCQEKMVTVGDWIAGVNWSAFDAAVESSKELRGAMDMKKKLTQVRMALANQAFDKMEDVFSAVSSALGLCDRATEDHSMLSTLKDSMLVGAFTEECTGECPKCDGNPCKICIKTCRAAPRHRIYCDECAKLFNPGDSFRRSLDASSTLCTRCYRRRFAPAKTMEGRAAQEKMKSAAYIKATAPSNGTEDLVQCSCCGDWGHLACFMHNVTSREEAPLACPKCPQLDQAPHRKRFDDLKKTNLGDYIEQELRASLERQHASEQAQSIHVRVVSVDNVEYDIDDIALETFGRQTEEGMERLRRKKRFVRKCVLLAQKQAGQDALVQALIVLEDGDDDSAVIEYMDTGAMYVGNKRGLVYRLVLALYVQHVFAHGATHVRLWSSPLEKDNLYFFFGHPPHQDLSADQGRLNGYYAGVHSILHMGRWVDGEAVQLSSVETLTRLQHALKRAKNELLTARSNDAECGFGDVERMARLPLVPVVPRLYPGCMLLSQLHHRQLEREVDINAVLTSDEESALTVCRTLVTTILLDGTTMAAVGAQLLRTESNPNDARFIAICTGLDNLRYETSVQFFMDTDASLEDLKEQCPAPNAPAVRNAIAFFTKVIEDAKATIGPDSGGAVLSGTRSQKQQQQQQQRDQRTGALQKLALEVRQASSTKTSSLGEPAEGLEHNSEQGRSPVGKRKVGVGGSVDRARGSGSDDNTAVSDISASARQRTTGGAVPVIRGRRAVAGRRRCHADEEDAADDPTDTISHDADRLEWILLRLQLACQDIDRLKGSLLVFERASKYPGKDSDGDNKCQYREGANWPGFTRHDDDPVGPHPLLGNRVGFLETLQFNALPMDSVRSTTHTFRAIVESLHNPAECVRRLMPQCVTCLEEGAGEPFIQQVRYHCDLCDMDWCSSHKPEPEFTDGYKKGKGEGKSSRYPRLCIIYCPDALCKGHLTPYTVSTVISH